MCISLLASKVAGVYPKDIITEMWNYECPWILTACLFWVSIKGAKETVVNKTNKDPCPHEAYVLGGKMNNKQNINVGRMYRILEKDWRGKN